MADCLRIAVRCFVDGGTSVLGANGMRKTDNRLKSTIFVCGKGGEGVWPAQNSKTSHHSPPIYAVCCLPQVKVQRFSGDRS